MTLIELIVGILLVCITLTLVLPFIDKVRSKAQRQGSANNMRRVGEAMHVYHDVYRSFPSQPKSPGQSKGNVTKAID